jgi:hypothetical protein
MNDAAVDAEIGRISEESVHQQALPFVGLAIKTLVGLMRSRKTPPGVRARSATDLLKLAEDPQHQAAVKGVTINILKLSTGEVKRVAGTEPVAHDVEAVMDEARELLEAGGEFRK